MAEEVTILLGILRDAWASIALASIPFVMSLRADGGWLNL
jgi:hypothetical protein